MTDDFHFAAFASAQSPGAAADDPDVTDGPAQQIQQRLITVQQQLEEAVVTGSTGAGAVTVTGNGTGEVSAVTISPAVDTADRSALGELIVAALADLARNREQIAAAAMRSIAGGFEDQALVGGTAEVPRTPEGLIDLS